MIAGDRGGRSRRTSRSLALLDKASGGKTVWRTPVKLLVTGAAGFIGFHTAQALLERGDEVVGLDNLNAYYDPTLKAARLAMLEREPRISLREARYRGSGGDGGAVRARAISARGASGRAGRRAPFDRESARLRRRATSPASCTSSKAAATRASSIWSTPRRVRSTGPTRSMPFSRDGRTSIIR